MKKITVIAMAALFLPGFVFAGTAREELIAQGVTEPVQDSTLAATVNGSVASITRKEGEAVKSGDIIVELDSDIEALEVTRRKLVADSKAKVQAAESRVETLRMDLDSTRQLFDASKSVSKEDMQKKELEFKLADAELQGLRMEEEREDIECQMAVAQLEKKRIRAPFDGVVVKIFMHVGENCNPQQPLVRVVDITKCYFVAHVEAALPWNLSAGDKVSLELQGGSVTITVPGVIEYVSSVVDPSSGLQEVRAVFENTDLRVRPGVRGTMKVVPADAR